MSGMAGLLLRDGVHVRTHDIERMIAAVPHRGRDAAKICCHKNIGFGNRLLWTTPESMYEDLPRPSASGDYLIAADARIDNREDLIAELGIRPGRDVLTDSELILRAWEKWAEAAPRKLIGDFSFAIWDNAAKKLFCVRDSAGTRCLYYYESSELFAFASEIKALTALPRIPCALNEARVADYLISLYEDRASTFYKGICRLPAASILTVTPTDLNIRTYWKLDPEREIRLRDEREYAEAFREKFDEAVRCRVRSAFPVGSAVSGGLDSSAIACTARRLVVAHDPSTRLHTFSIIFPGVPEFERRAIDERSWIETVLRTGGFEPHYVRGDELNPLQDSREVHYHLDEANFAPNLYLHWGMYGSARDHGVRVFLDGLDGDTTVSHGFEYLEELARRLHWRKLHQEASLLAKNLLGGSKASKVIWNYCARDMAPVWMIRLWRLAHGRFRDMRPNGTLAHPDFAARMKLRQRALELTPAGRPRTAREHHARVLNLALYAHSLEMADKAAAAFGIEARYPFFDRRLIEFCLSVPADQKLRGGWNRAIFRRAMEGVLPREIQWRSGKGNLSSNFHRRLLESNGSVLDGIASRNDNLFSRYVDTGEMRAALRQYRTAPATEGPRHSIRLFMAANLALWLEQAHMKPFTPSLSSLHSAAAG